jgi:hypothetical protein
VGKKVVGLQINFSESETPRVIRVFIRTVSRFIPLEPLSIFFDKEMIMWHDRFSKTRVIEINS